MSYDVDVLVAGGGPVGLAAAIEAVSAGFSCAVLDPRRSPVDKACGEGLMPAARSALWRLGVSPPGVPFRGIRYLGPRPGRWAQVDSAFRAGPGLGVRRTALSEALAARADALGVRREPVAVRAVEQDAEGVTAAGLRARWLLAADGLHSPIRRCLGLDRPAGGAHRFGLRRHYRIEPWTDLVEVYWSDSAEAYVTPVAPDLVGVAVLCGGGRPYEQWLADFPRLAGRLRGAEPVTPVRGAGPLRTLASRRVAGRVLLVGDAAGYLDALTGEGIAIGLREARAAVSSLVAGRTDEYEAAWRAATRRYRLLTGGLLWAAGRPALRRAIVPAAARLPALFGGIVNSLG